MAVIRNILVVTALVATWVAAPLAQAETLSDALIAAYRNSNLLDQNRALLRAADENVAGGQLCASIQLSQQRGAHSAYPAIHHRFA